MRRNSLNHSDGDEAATKPLYDPSAAAPLLSATSPASTEDNVCCCAQCAFACTSACRAPLCDTRESDFARPSFSGDFEAPLSPRPCCRVVCCCDGGRQCCDACCTLGRCWCLLVSFVFLLCATAAVLYVLFVLRPHGHSPTPSPPPGRVPDAPLAPEVNPGISDAALSWLAPSDHGFTIVSYTARYRAGNGTAWSLVDGVHALSVDVPNLRAATAYVFGVCACNAFGCSNYSADARAVTLNATRPDAPGQPTPVDAGTTYVAIAWSASVAHGAQVSGYEVESAPVVASAALHASGWTLACRTLGALACNLTSLPPAAALVLRVRAIAGAGGTLDSAWGANVSLHTQAPHAVVPAAPATLVGLAADSASIVLCFSRPGDDGGAEIVAYALAYDALPPTAPWPSNATREVRVRVAAPVDEQRATLDALEPSTPYRFGVRALNAIGAGAWSALATAATPAIAPPAPPLDLTLTSVSAASIALAWTAGASAPSAPVTAFELQQDDWWARAPLAFATIYTGAQVAFVAQTDLLPASVYRFRVRDANVAGFGNYSLIAAFTTDDAGNCGNAADLQVFFKYKGTGQLKPAVRTCIRQCVGQPDTCAQQCIVAATGMSVNCASCWAAEGDCVAAKCFLQCLDPNSDACKACSKANCFPATLVCSGLPEFVFPS